MAAETTQEVTVEETVKGETKFGIGQLKNPTPVWATWVFRSYLYIASILTVIVTTDSDINSLTAKRIAKYLAYGTMAVHGATKLFGVKVDEDEFKTKG